MEAIEDTCPLEDRVPDRRVFQGSPRRPHAGDESGVQTAKVPHYPPHDLVIAGSRSGTSRASLRGNSRSVPDTLGRR